MILENLLGPHRPLSWVFRFWPVLAGAFLGSLGATWLCKKVALKFGIVDQPDHTVKTHKEPIAYLGGVGMLIGLTVGVFAGIGCLKDEILFGPMLGWLVAVLAGAAIACAVGLADDIFDLKPSQKILGQVMAAVFLLLAGIVPNLQRIVGPLNLPLPHALEVVLQVIIVLFFVLGATNSLNLLDGLDGLCAGVTAIITTAMLLLAVHLATWGASEIAIADPVRIIICLALVGGTCGFLPFNRYPILFAEQIPRWWMASVVVFGLPILDTGVALVRRLINRRPLFVSDRGHIYDQMIDVLSAFIVWKKGYLKMEGLRGALPKEN
jgi:UDP-GlcNAc:undecaprenyl-phosphate GlcNAc-1-phosphate transferase